MVVRLVWGMWVLSWEARMARGGWEFRGLRAGGLRRSEGAGDGAARLSLAP